MQNEERKIRDMLADGRLTPAEAESQLAALRRNAEQPVIDIGDGTDEPQPALGRRAQWQERAQRFKARWWRREFIPTYVMLAPMLFMMVASALLLTTAVAVGLAIVALFVPALAIMVIWNQALTATMHWRPISMIEAYVIAFVVALLVQALRRWRR